jgi:hypothetical protein
MAHPDPRRQGSERDQRRHVGTTSEHSDVGIQDKSQGKSGTATPERQAHDPARAPRGEDQPEAGGQR